MPKTEPERSLRNAFQVMERKKVKRLRLNTLYVLNRCDIATKWAKKAVTDFRLNMRAGFSAQKLAQKTFLVKLLVLCSLGEVLEHSASLFLATE